MSVHASWQRGWAYSTSPVSSVRSAVSWWVTLPADVVVEVTDRVLPDASFAPI